MIKEVLLVHHSHTDIGFTHPQPVIFELHDRFIEEALDLADATKDEREDCRFRWTCEVTGTTRRWWEDASEFQRKRFLNAVSRGQVEVAGMEWHLTPLADARMLVRSMQSATFFRSLGVPVRSAMNTDVNGVPWGLVDVLLDHGITGFSMSINAHFGAAPTPRPGAFRWVSPSGREIVAWNGFQYWHAANGRMGIPESIERVEKDMPAFLKETTERGYPFSFLPVQITDTHHADNAGPDPAISPFVKAWNDRDPEVRLRCVLLSEVLDRLRAEDLPVFSGDWTDYWNFGAGSSARETAVYFEGLRVLDGAHSAAVWPGEPAPREQKHLDVAYEQLALYAEHTWGADCSIWSPESLETRIQWSMKSVLAFEGLSHARIVRRDALKRLAAHAGGDEHTALIYNPLSVPTSQPIAVPTGNLDWNLIPDDEHRQRIDGLFANLERPKPSGSTSRWVLAKAPAMGFSAVPLSDLETLGSTGLSSDEDRLSSPHVEIVFDTVNGGVHSLVTEGKEYAGKDEELKFGVPLLERPSGGKRNEIMAINFSQFEPADGWNTGWKADRLPGKLICHETLCPAGAVEHVQTFEMANGDRVTLVYRLFADEPGVDLEATVHSAGDSSPYSLVLPFVLPDSGKNTWHFDTAGALVEFDKEQLPNACRHYVTARHFVRLQTEDAGLSVASPDCALWKFGGMFFTRSKDLDPTERRPVLLAWLTNNYWEVNFLADQRGQTRYHFRLLPHAPESVELSYERALPYGNPPHVHLYRDQGPNRVKEGALLDWEGDGVCLEFAAKAGDKTLLAIWNLRSEANSVTLRPGSLKWKAAHRSSLAGVPLSELPLDGSGSVQIELPPRSLTGLLLS